MVAVDPLIAFGWNSRVEQLFLALREPFEQAGRIVRVERTRSIAASADGRERSLTTSTPVAVGDWVTLRQDAVETVLPRWSVLSRQHPNGTRTQLLAANVDLVLIAVPADRLRAPRVERELAIAWESGARPVVVLTKADVAAFAAHRRLAERLAGVEVMATSSITGAGIEAIAQLLRPDLTAVLLGPSGSGKSTLTNAILGSDRLATGAVRTGDHRGRHTTTSRQLVALPGGGVLIDTPGLRSLGLVGDTLMQVFPDIERLAATCRFTDCRHDGEPGCAVTASLASGELDAARYSSFKKLGDAREDGERHDDEVSRLAAKVRNQRVRPTSARGGRRPR